jgi:hypothetical protein
MMSPTSFDVLIIEGKATCACGTQPQVVGPPSDDNTVKVWLQLEGLARQS